MDQGDLAAAAALDEPTRRSLYDHVARQPGPVSRDEVAAATGIARGTVAFHLDKLVDGGLLAVTYERRTGRSGPGAGRPAKLYRRGERQVSVSLPQRQYELAGDLLAAAVEEADRAGAPPRQVLRDHARRRGEELGTAARTDGSAEATRQTLDELGFEPRADGTGLLLANCPFHRLAQSHTDLVCGMNLSLIEGLLHALRCPGLRARLAPSPGFCCVRLDASG
jgi:predicted ArsR family transcriptional regulator